MDVVKVAVVLFAVLGCHHAKPQAQVYGGAKGTFLVGSRISLGATWNATCTDWGAAFAGILDSKDHGPGDDKRSCRHKAFEFTLACSSTCDHSLATQSVGSTSVYVVPLEVGPLTLDATSKRVDTGEIKKFSFPLTIALPDKLELECKPREGASAPCGPDGVSAVEPIIVPVIRFDGQPASSTLLRINGNKHPHEDTGRVSLVDLYPEAAQGHGIKPGTYEVTLELAGMTSKWQVVAQ